MVVFECDRFKEVTRDCLKISEVDSDLNINNLYIEQSGKPIVPIIGEFHFSRYPSDLWEDAIARMKAGGITVISTYLFWIYHEEIEGAYDFEGDKDIRRFLELCEKYDMLVLARIGPWCHGEVIYGGFPEFIQQRDDKRTNAPVYMKKVKSIYRAYYEQMKDHFYQDGSVLIGIQIENEYGGNDPTYISALREMALEIGFRLPMYTITAWPPNGQLTGDLLPMFGRYPARPWAGHIEPLPMDNRFHIMDEKIDKGIGTDVLKGVKWEELPYDDFPYATCELGCGIQVTEHRRPVISSQDAYSVLLIQLAQGVNAPGYYMYHGGRNQPGGAYHESKKSGYDNDCPVSSYDFQAPISEYGQLRESYHMLKLVHLFLKDFGHQFALMQPFFTYDSDGAVNKRIAVRMDNEGSGYVFINNYQRLYAFEAIAGERIEVRHGDSRTVIDQLHVPSGKSLMFPINMTLGGFKFDFITAQLVCCEQVDGFERYYFFIPEGMECRYRLSTDDVKGTEHGLLPSDSGQPVLRHEFGGGSTEIYLLTEEKAKTLWKLQDQVMFSDEPLLEHQGSIFVEEDVAGQTLDYGTAEIVLNEVANETFYYDEYLFGDGTKETYELIIPDRLMDNLDDVLIRFKLTGNAVQMYFGSDLVADWFNYDGYWSVGLKRLKSHIEGGKRCLIQVAPIGKKRPVYFERDMIREKAELEIEGIQYIKRRVLGE